MMYFLLQSNTKIMNKQKDVRILTKETNKRTNINERQRFKDRGLKTEEHMSFMSYATNIKEKDTFDKTILRQNV